MSSEDPTASEMRAVLAKLVDTRTQMLSEIEMFPFEFAMHDEPLPLKAQSLLIEMRANVEKIDLLIDEFKRRLDV